MWSLYQEGVLKWIIIMQFIVVNIVMKSLVILSETKQKNTVDELIDRLEWTHAIHHCDSDHRCLADFIGIEIVEDK